MPLPPNAPDKVPYKPSDVTVRVSTAAFVSPEAPGEVPDRLDLSWSRPSVDAATNMFDTDDGGERSSRVKNALIFRLKITTGHSSAHFCLPTWSTFVCLAT